MTIGSQVRKYRILKGWNLRELGEKAGLAASTLSDIENDKAMPSIKRLRNIAEALGVSLEELLKQE